jgi:UDP-glucose 4-epimerase
VDFWEGTYLTQNVLEAMRVNQVKQLIYPSGSGVYGDTGEQPVFELFSPMTPISTYGASKLAGESLISAYCHMFDMHAAVFRFANVVGPNQTHGVAYDFIRRLTSDSSTLHILGNGKQSKSYIYVDDVVAALLLIYQQGLKGYDFFNVATEDYITVKEIADLVVDRMKLTDVTYQFQGGDRGWKGDVPVVRFNTDKIRNRGWKNQRTSTQAMLASIDSMIQEHVGPSFRDLSTVL